MDSTLKVPQPEFAQTSDQVDPTVDQVSFPNSDAVLAIDESAGATVPQLAAAASPQQSQALNLGDQVALPPEALIALAALPVGEVVLETEANTAPQGGGASVYQDNLGEAPTGLEGQGGLGDEVLVVLPLPANDEAGSSAASAEGTPSVVGETNDEDSGEGDQQTAGTGGTDGSGGTDDTDDTDDQQTVVAGNSGRQQRGYRWLRRCR